MYTVRNNRQMPAATGFTFLIAPIVMLAAPSSATPSRHRNGLIWIVMISVVDMLSGEIMDRYSAGLPGGLGRLEKEGVFFENAFQEHAFTETGPGHSVLLSGRHPASTGIPANHGATVRPARLSTAFRIRAPRTLASLPEKPVPAEGVSREQLSATG